MASSFLQASAGSLLSFSPGLPAPSCVSAGSQNGAIPTTADINCQLEYVAASGLTSDIVALASASADWGQLKLYASTDWTNFNGPTRFSPVSWNPASTSASARSRWEGKVLNYSSSPVTYTLSGVLGMGGNFTVEDQGIAATVFNGPFHAGLFMGTELTASPERLLGGTFQTTVLDPHVAQSCTTTLTFDVGPAHPDGMGNIVPGFATLTIITRGDVSVVQNSAIFNNTPGEYSMVGDFAHTVSVSAFRLMDGSGHIVPLSSLDIATDTPVTLTDHGFAAAGAAEPTAVPEPATMWLGATGLAMFARSRRRARRTRPKAA